MSTFPNKHPEIILFGGYYLAWFLPRLPAIMNNTLHYDDFYGFILLNHPLETITQGNFCSIPPPDFRWLGYAVGCVLGQYIPTWSIVVTPKLAAGLFIAAFSILIFRLLIQWTVSPAIALLVPLIFILHPIVNELTLWNSTAFFSLWLVLCIAAFFLVGMSRPLWQQAMGIILLIMAVLAYEIYFVAFLILLFSEPVFSHIGGQNIEWRETRRKFLIFCAIAVFYVSQVLMTLYIFGKPAGRGLVVIHSFSAYFAEKIHGIFNLIVNTYMPLVSYYSGLEIAWSAWKWIPITISIMIFVFGYFLRRSWRDAIVLAGFSLILLVVPTLPVFVMSQSPESWRVSIPVLLAVCLTITLMATLIWNLASQLPARLIFLERITKGLAVATVALVIVAEVPVTFAEAQLRVFENRADQTLLEAIEGYWSAQGLKQGQYRVGVIGNLDLPVLTPTDLAPALQISVSYHARGLSSGLDNDFSWRGLLMLHGFGVVELDGKDAQTTKGCNQRPEFCKLRLRDELASRCSDHPDFINPANSWRLVHDLDQRITAICR